MKKKLILLTALFVCGFIELIGIIHLKNDIKEKEEIIKKLNFKPNRDFGIISNEDIYIDNMEKGKYTKHGRLITKD
jgi:hypothetical protein